MPPRSWRSRSGENARAGLGERGLRPLPGRGGDIPADPQVPGGAPATRVAGDHPDKIPAGPLGTADEKIRVLLEPGAPPVSERIRALDRLHAAGIKTFVMIAPILPGVEGLIDRLPGKVDNILVDRLNYARANRVYAANKLEWARQDRFFRDKAEELSRGFRARQIPVHVLF